MPLTYSLLIGLLVVAGLAAQPRNVKFHEPRPLPILDNAAAFVIAADVNSDGYTDLALSVPKGIEVWLHDSHGGFQKPSLIPLEIQAMVVASGDFHGKGITDLILQTEQDILLLPGLGGGKFGHPTVLVTGAAGKNGAVLAADFNGDGKLDLLTYQRVSSDTTNLILRLGNGDGTFHNAGQWALPALTAGVFITTADFNGDGNLDLFVLLQDVSDSRNQVGAIIWGDGHGGLSGGPTVDAAQSSQPVPGVGDINGDGLADLLIPVAYAGPNQVQVLLGNGDGTFRNGPILATSERPGAVVLADVNHDGKPDVVVVSLSDSISVMYGKGNGNFTAERDYFAGETDCQGPMPCSPLLINGPHGLDDIVIQGQYSPVSALGNVLTVLPVTQSGIDSPRLLQPGASAFQAVSGDFNGDGKLDLAVGLPTGIGILSGNGDGTFQRLSPYAGYPGYWPLAVADVNRDGVPDVIVYYYQGQLGVFLGQGDGSFQALGTQPVLTGLSYPLVVDVNGDGIPDLVDVGPVVYLGKGDGTFANCISSGGPTALEGPLVAGDFNGDGKVDLAGTNAVLLGNGDGTFGAPIQSTNVYAVQAAADLNGDGILDLVGSTNPHGGNSINLAVAFGHGDGTFSAPATYALPLGYTPGEPIIVADWNGDGHPDIGVGGVYEYFLLGDGKGNFAAQPNGIMLYGYYGGYGLTVGDFNGDGLPDIASANGAVWVMRNESK